MSAAPGRSRGQGWPQATAGGGAKRPWRRRGRREASWSGTIGARRERADM